MNNLVKYIKANSRKISIFFITLFFVTFPMIMTYDSAHYMGYVQIFGNALPFSIYYSLVTWFSKIDPIHLHFLL